MLNLDQESLRESYVSESELIREMDMSCVKGASILLAEDNDINQEILVELVTAFGLFIEVAENGKTALDLLNQRKFDLVLMDMQMPVLNGTDATREIRKNSIWKNLPIIALTGNAREEDRIACMDAGMNDFLFKPIDPVELGRVFLKWISRTGKELIISQNRPETESSQKSFLSNIKGLDVALGLSRVVGNKSVYISILRKFISGRKNTMPLIRHYLETDNQEEALRLLHTMKGIAGNIGAMQVFDLSYELENSLKKDNNREEVESNLLSLETSLQELIEDLEKALPPEYEFTKIPVEEKRLNKICANLLQLLQDDDTAATYFLEEYNDLLASAFSEDFSKIKEATKSYEFEIAISAIERARKSRNLRVR